jgi:hypothetical protein
MHQLCFIDNKTTFANKDKTIGGSLLQATSCTQGALLLQARRLCSSDVKGFVLVWLIQLPVGDWKSMFGSNQCIYECDSWMGYKLDQWIGQSWLGRKGFQYVQVPPCLLLAIQVYRMSSCCADGLHYGRSPKLHFQKHCTLCLPTKKTNKTTTIPNVIFQVCTFCTGNRSEENCLHRITHIRDSVKTVTEAAKRFPKRHQQLVPSGNVSST